jgi:mannose-6-phosphate isomerase
MARRDAAEPTDPPWPYDEPGVWRRPGEERVVPKPWGREVWWALTPHYLGKRLEVRAGHALSLQKHRRKVETLVIAQGRVRVTVGTEVTVRGAGEAITLLPDTLHRLEAVEDAVIYEVSTPEWDDVVRLEDRYGRA